MVVVEYYLEFPGRDVNSIRRKYILLHRKKIPTVNPRMPLGVRMDKCIEYKIGYKTELDDGTG